MSLFFSGFEFGCNFFTPSESRLPNDHKQGKVNLSRLFTCRFLSAALLSLIVVPTLNAAPPGSTPPTYYYSGSYYVTQTGPTPDIVAQAAVSEFNSRGGGQIVNLQACSTIYVLQIGGYVCYGDYCRTPGDCTFGNQAVVYARCGPQSGPQEAAQWDGIEFYCPPEPDCPAH